MIDYKIITSSSLFKSIPEKGIENILKYLDAKVVNFTKEQEIHRIGDKIETIGLVLSGTVHILKYDAWGNLNIIDNIEQGNVFAEAYAVQKEIMSMISVVSAKDAEILFVKTDKILNEYLPYPPYYQQLTGNLLRLLAFKNLKLIKKIEHITPKSVREKILSYLSSQNEVGNKERFFDIPFNRQQMADYLLIERSVLSHELSKMKQEGIIDYHKNSFSLKIGG